MAPYLRVKSGLPFLDEASKGGLPSGDLNVIATDDDRSGSMVLGHYLIEGLKEGQKVALITFDKAHAFFENFQFGDLPLQKYFEDEQLFFLNYQPSIRQKINFIQSYDAVFEEILRLCNNSFPSRIAFHQVDALLNISNIQLSHLTAEKFGSSCKEKIKMSSSILAHFVKFPDTNHHDLAVALEKVAAGYFELCNNGGLQKNQTLKFNIRKLPWFDYETGVHIINEEKVRELFGKSPRKLHRAIA